VGGSELNEMPAAFRIFRRVRLVDARTIIFRVYQRV
jgi:hypothetical protein